MWKVKFYFNKIKDKFTRPKVDPMDWLSLVIGGLNLYFAYIALLTGNIMSLIINGFFLYISFKNLTR